jgi:hypothetical protein
LRSTSLPADDKYDDAALTESDRAAQVRYRVEAIRCLDAAVNAGWTNLSAFTDPELVPIRQHPAYDEIAERLRSAARLDTGASESGSQ